MKEEPGGTGASSEKSPERFKLVLWAKEHEAGERQSGLRSQSSV